MRMQTKIEPPIEGAKSTSGPTQPVLLSREDLLELGIRYSREHIRRLEAEGKFPRRVRLSPGRIAWMFNEVMAWLNDRAEEREQTSAI